MTHYWDGGEHVPSRSGPDRGSPTLPEGRASWQWPERCTQSVAHTFAGQDRGLVYGQRS